MGDRATISRLKHIRTDPEGLYPFGKRAHTVEDGVRELIVVHPPEDPFDELLATSVPGTKPMPVSLCFFRDTLDVLVGLGGDLLGVDNGLIKDTLLAGRAAKEMGLSLSVGGAGANEIA